MENRGWMILAFFLFFAQIQAETIHADSLTHSIKRSFHDKMFAVDKGHHFAASAMIVGLSFYSLHQEMNISRPLSTQASIGVAFSVGAAKEIYDGLSGKGSASFLDLAADVAGIALAALLLNLPTP
jgi:uncharacterized protein YfiM (DUF2279 family)